jgi:hypothetical protein
MNSNRPRNDERLSQMAEMKLPNGGGASLGNKPQTMRNQSQHAQTLDVITTGDNTRASELPNIVKASTVTTSPNSKPQKSVKASTI